MFKSLSQRFAGQGLLFAEVHRDVATADLLASQGVTQAPALVALPAGAGPKGKIFYAGEPTGWELKVLSRQRRVLVLALGWVV